MYLLCSEDVKRERVDLDVKERERKKWFYNDIKNWSVTRLSGSYQLLTSWGYDSAYFALRSRH